MFSLSHFLTSVPSEKLSGKLSEYGLIVPFSTDSRGRYLSHVVSAGSGSQGDDDDAERDGGPGSGRRVARSVPAMPKVASSSQRLFFNVTVFGKELHLRLRANRRLVAPGAFVEWQEDFLERAKERIYGDCIFTGDVSDMPEASVAISNCDGLVSPPIVVRRSACFCASACICRHRKCSKRILNSFASVFERDSNDFPTSARRHVWSWLSVHGFSIGHRLSRQPITGLRIWIELRVFGAFKCMCFCQLRSSNHMFSLHMLLANSMMMMYRVPQSVCLPVPEDLGGYC